MNDNDTTQKNLTLINKDNFLNSKNKKNKIFLKNALVKKFISKNCLFNLIKSQNPSLYQLGED
jgi:hypothetical protein